MKKAAWIKKITAACVEVGTYQEAFDSVIETLAGILERRDEAQQLFKASGGSVLVMHTNKSGAANPEVNPALRLVNSLNMDALAYWRDLGLTPAGLKKINEQGLKPKKKTTLGEVLSEIEGL